MSTDAQTLDVKARWLSVLCAWLLCLLPAMPVAAVTYQNLYTVTVEPDPEARDRRASAIERAMAILLTRVTGRPQAAAYPELRPLVDAAPQLVTSYGAVDGERDRVGFNGAAVQARLTELDWPVWGAERPQLVLWAAIDFGDGQRALLAAEDGPVVGDAPTLSLPQIEFRNTLRDEMVRAADERGLPMRLPLMDATDAEYSSFAAVWGGFDGVLMQASERYGADFVLNARAAFTDLGLAIDWQLVGPDGGERRLVTSSAREGIDWVADLFAAEFASSGGLRDLRIDVEGITSIVEYGRVMQYLGTLSIVETLDVESFNGEVLELNAAIRGDDSMLERVFELGGVLRPVEPEPFAPALPGDARRFVLAGAGLPRR